MSEWTAQKLHDAAAHIRSVRACEECQEIADKLDRLAAEREPSIIREEDEVKEITAKECRDTAARARGGTIIVLPNNVDYESIAKLLEPAREAAELLDRLAAEREPASDAVRTSAREFIAAVDEHCELQVGDDVEIIGPDFAGSTKSIGERVKIQQPRDCDGDYLVDDTQWSSYPASSLRKITAPAPLLPVGTLVTHGGGMCDVTGHSDDDFPLTLQTHHTGRVFNALVDDVQPLIPAYLAKGNTYAATTGKWRISDGKLELEIIYAYYRGYPSTCYWPLAECKPLADDPRWEASNG